MMFYYMKLVFHNGKQCRFDLNFFLPNYCYSTSKLFKFGILN